MSFKMAMTPKCKKCGRRFPVGNLPGGIPAMVGMQMQDGTVINLCGYCITKLGSLDKEGAKEFWRELGINIDGDEKAD